MAQTTSKFIKFGTGVDEVNSRELPAHFTPTNYTPDQVGTEGADKVSAHLKGIDDALGSIVGTSGDISHTVWSGLANNTADQDITGLAFAGTVRSFEALISLTIDATSDLFASYKIYGVQRSADWVINTEYVGDPITGLSFSITAGGQVRVSIGNIAGFSSGEAAFRAIVTLA